MSQSSLKETKNGLQTPVDRFTVDLLRKISEESSNGNTLVSPIGIIVQYTILLEGAHGPTADEIMHVFHLKPQFKKVEKVRIEMKKVCIQSVTHLEYYLNR